MSIDWLHEQTITGQIEFPGVWSSSGILISISNLTPPSWRKIGYLQIDALIDGIYFKTPIRTIEFGESLIHIPYNTYRLIFEPIDKLLILHPSISIKIAKFNLNMFLTNPSSVQPEIGEATHTSVIPLQPGQPNGSAFVIAAAKPRHSVSIKNGTNRPMRIREGSLTATPPLTGSDPFTEIPANGSYTVLQYSGDITGIMAGIFASGGKIFVKELPYI